MWIPGMIALLAAAPSAAAVLPPFSLETTSASAALQSENATLRQGTRGGGQVLEITFEPAARSQVRQVFAGGQDWSASGGLALDLRNPGREPVRVSVGVDDDKGGAGLAGSVLLAPGSAQTVTLPLVLTQGQKGEMRSAPSFPGRRLVTAGGRLQADRITGWRLFVEQPPRPVTLLVDNVRLVPAPSLDAIADRFGQYTRAEWPGKVGDDNDLRRKHGEEPAALGPAPADRDPYGGWQAGPKLRATGHFRTERHGGRWWLVTPEGHLFFSLGLNGVRIGGSSATPVTGREKMFTWLPEKDDPLARHYGTDRGARTFNFYGANLQRVYGTDAEAPWAERTARRLRAWGFNTLGNWSSTEPFRPHKLAYTAPILFGNDLPSFPMGRKTVFDVFDARFPAAADRAIAEAARDKKDDPWCLGFFVHNEIQWAAWGQEKGHALPRSILAGPGESAAKRAFALWLRDKYGAVDRLNAAWQTKLASWEQFEKDPVTLPPALSEGQRGDLGALLRLFASRYFRTVHDALRRHAPHKLYLGSRFHVLPMEVVEEAARYCDVVSFNAYQRELDPAAWAFTAKLGKPCLIGEFHFGALDRGHFQASHGPAMDSQVERGRAYARYVRSVLALPAFVGCHWFSYADQPLTGRADGENYNIGFVAVTDLPHPELVTAAAELNRNIYQELSQYAPAPREASL